MLIGLALRSVSQDERRDEKLLSVLRVLFVGVYFWAGFFKFNRSFFSAVFPWMIGGVTPPSMFSVVSAFGILVPLIECGFALGLIFEKTRKPAVLMLAFMHLFILICLGPFGRNWNHFVWPWNVTMAGFVILLFWDFRGPFFIRRNLRSVYALLIALLVGVCPFLNVFGYWDHYLSFHLYSGATPEAYLELNQGDGFPPALRRYLSHPPNEKMARVLYTDLVMSEVGMTPYPSARYYKKLFRMLCPQIGESFDLVIEYKPLFFGRGKKRERLSCADIS